MDARNPHRPWRLGPEASRRAEDAEGPPDRSGGARRGARAARRPAAPARPADRAPASDPGPLRPSLGRASRGARRRDEAGADRGLRGRDLLRAFRCREGRRGPAAAGHGARVRFTLLRDGRRGAFAREPPGKARARRARRARAVHGRVRPRAGLRGRPRAGDAGGRGEHGRGRAEKRARPCAPAADRFRRVSRAGRLQAARRVPLGRAHARGYHQGGGRRRAARARRRRLSHRPQVDAGAAIARPAADGGERRRRRARHLQGPLLSGSRPAPLHRRHADRRLGGRGGRRLRLHPRRISRADPDAARGVFPRRRGRPFARTRASICAAAPAPTSAAKSPR